MIVTLDTNIIRKDWLMRGGDFQVFIELLAKTNSKVKLPKVIHDELKHSYKRTLKEKLGSLNALQSLLVDHDLLRAEVDVDNQTRKYMAYLGRTLGLGKDNIIPYKNEWLPDLVDRANKRRPPSRERKEEFRDGLIWLTVLEIASAPDEKAIVLISNDGGFTAEKKGKLRKHEASESPDNITEARLHPDLESEAESRGVSVKFYQSLRSFLDEHSDPVRTIDEQWIEQEVDLDRIGNRLFEEASHDVTLREWLRRQDQRCVHETAVGSLGTKLSDYHLHTMDSDGTIRIRAVFNMDLWVAYLVDERTEPGPPAVSGATGYTASNTRDIYPVVRGHFHITVRDKHVTKVELESWNYSMAWPHILRGRDTV